MAALPALPSIGRQALNITLCVVLYSSIFLFLRQGSHFLPFTMESLGQIALAEINRRKNIRRIRRLEQGFDEEQLVSKKERAVKHIASVVGYREEPNLYRKCLQSYRGSPGLEIMLMGIDGDHEGDMEMIQVAEEVFPDLTKIHIQEPFGPLAVRLAQSYVDRSFDDEKCLGKRLHTKSNDPDLLPKKLVEESHRYAFKILFDKAVKTLEDHGALTTQGKQSLRPICLYQPHICKKEIMFTNLIFCIALGHANGIDHLWTSDSDTWVHEDTMYKVIGCMSTDPLIGGSCTALSIHNGQESMIAALGAAAYWTELAITRGQSGAVDAVDCQPGPCAAFRLIALESVLLSWYTQTCLGIKTVVNEDRHLTTNLLLDGWKVTLNTETLASTDTPTTLIRWLLQQLRWARATHIETFQYPHVYAIHSPILFITALRRFYTPLIIGAFTIRYVLTGKCVHAHSFLDLTTRIACCTLYNRAVNKHKVNGLLYLVLSQIFYQIPLPGIMFWSVLTVVEGGWGTSMRNQNEAQKAKKAGWENLWSATSIVVWMAFVAAGMARYVASRYIPEFMVELMIFSAAAMASSLYYALLW